VISELPAREYCVSQRHFQTTKFNFETCRCTKLPALRVGILALIALVFGSGTVQAQFTYETNQSTITITGYTGAENVVTIPDEINGLPVRRIGDDAFLHSDVSEVVIPEGVNEHREKRLSLLQEPCQHYASGNSQRHLVRGHFFFSALTHVEIPDGVTSIGPSAFLGARFSPILRFRTASPTLACQRSPIARA
jgi:hypothetical protein